MHKKFIYGAVALIALIGLIGCNSAEKKSDSFMNTAAQGGMFEVQLGKLALTKGQSADVKAFAERMVTDHTKANNELKAVAARKNVTLPGEINSDQKSMMEKLSGMSGADFDKEYVKMMVSDHEEDVKAFKTQATEGTDADVKAFAAKTLPTLESHFTQIKGIQDKM